MIPGSANPLLLATAAPTDYNIERSLRFNSSDSAYLSRDFTGKTSTNNKICTYSFWLKRSALTTEGQLEFYLFNAQASGYFIGQKFGFRSELGAKLWLEFGRVSGGATAVLTGTPELRDPSAWYHIVISIDTTNATSENRVFVYVNGAIMPVTGTYPPQDYELQFQQASSSKIGSRGDNYHFSGYLADVHLVDGQALTPSSFTEVSATTGQLIPKAYTGTYGTNGFHLPFSDNSTAAALGTDTSGNGNDWTVNNLSVAPTNTSNYWSGNFDGNGDFLTFTKQTTTSSFTCECWFYRGSNVTGYHIVFGGSNAGNVNPDNVQLTVSNTGAVALTLGGGGVIAATGTAVAQFQWNHIAWVRSGSSCAIFVNGNRIATGTSSAALNVDRIGSVGGIASGSYDARGFISNARITTSAVYDVTQSTYTVPTAPLTSITNTYLLTLQNSTFIDNSPNSLTVTANGNVSTSPLNPFWNPANNDSLVDTPTNGSQTDTGVGGEVVGNYATLNPLGTAGAIPTNGNLSVLSSTIVGNRISTFFLTSGKWYWEGVGYGYVGAIVGRGGEGWTGSISGTGSKAIGWWPVGPVYWDGGNNGGGTTYTSTDVIGVALDMDAGNVKFYKNGSLIYTITFGSGTVPNLSSGVFPAYNNGTGFSYSVDFNFGQRPFAYTAPSGYKALCTTNLDPPVVAQPSTVMDVVTYTGNGSTQTISGLGFSPDLVWTKSRNIVDSNALYDTVRGATNYLSSNTTAAEQVVSQGITAFTSDGFTSGSNTGSNGSGYTYVAWTWDAGSSTVTNTQGSITSSVRANASAGFSVVGGEGNTYFGGTLGHGLGVAPEFILAKDRDSTAQWYVYHKSLTNPNNYHLILNSTSAQVNFGSNLWNVTSTTIASNQGITGRRGVYYCFAPVAGYSSAFTYTANGSNDGPMVYLGFRPKFILLKSSNIANTEWMMWDAARGNYNVVNPYLLANRSNAEGSTGAIDFLSNGFKLRNISDSWNNSGGTGTYVGFAWAESPFQYARAR